MLGHCVVCESEAEIGRRGDIDQFRCERCGPFDISGSAAAVLKGRVKKATGERDELVVAKISHYIRTHTNEGAWLRVQSDMLDDMVTLKLPAPSKQLETLLRWMAEQAGDDHYRALEFSENEICAIIGAASPDAASEIIDDAQNSGLIEFVPDDCYQLTRTGWDWVSASIPSQPTRHTADNFVDPVRLDQLRAISGGQHDPSRLARMCEEINSAWRSGCTISVAMLARAIIDHVPPVFGSQTFAQVSSQMPRSIRGNFQHIQDSLRHIADGALHTHIRARETIPTAVQVDFRQSFDVLLGEVVRHLE
ncbi:hypothetical protein HFN65_25545 [Rhizobium laguerreae]|uniref:DUF4145 domain-containing protein n=1 Tax=Rhizobium hidalgonense TaxID=1538159 RepID=A0AAJ2H1E4_9HYPH|nr:MULTISPECIES: hypothetical protein [Rhizobium]MBY3122634.1 hypothetical protein [Rhizobium laguerreae]MBY3143569.1 hypothetical protein [Rhizobium laguerreae]MBY3574320.1 hypothetical protein [Rhizobium laguerreae]MDR9776158.1 hypothetical protein [Rhizobium hidalgonense]MDR9814303.1 hypothetical protein [Rhizobium hidalgonense]